MTKKHKKTGLKTLPHENKQESTQHEHAENQTSVRLLHAEQKVVFSWIAPEYVSHPKSKRWYVIAALLLAAAVAFALLTDNWTMALAAIVFAVVYIYTHTYHPPKNQPVVISELGIRMGRMFFPYSDIRAFWLIYKPDWQTLNLRVSKRWFSEISIHLNGMDPVELRQYLVGQIPEWEGKDEQLGDIILRLLKL